MLFTFTFFSSNEKHSTALGVQLFSMIYSIELWVKFNHVNALFRHPPKQ
jgi:hypothetical protein